MPKYEFDAVRWCEVNAKAYAKRGDSDTAAILRKIAEEIKQLRRDVAAMMERGE